MNVLFFGMLGEFSRLPLLALLEAGFTVTGVIVPAEVSADPIRELKPVTAGSGQAASAGSGQAASAGSGQAASAGSGQAFQLMPKQANIVHLAWQRGIPVYEVSRLAAPETRQTLAELHPDVACVACFNKRIPAALLALPRHGFLNVHPSLLPQFRGPAPLFWMFRAGVQETGVTIHFMDEGMDTGDIALQAPLTLPDGVSGPEADVLSGSLGGQLLVDTLHRLASDALTRTPQPPSGSAQPWPQAADFRIPASWSARRAFNFMRGTAVFGQPFVLEREEGEMVVETAPHAYQAKTIGSKNELF